MYYITATAVSFNPDDEDFLLQYIYHYLLDSIWLLIPHSKEV
jgi:hypothetical protein